MVPHIESNGIFLPLEHESLWYVHQLGTASDKEYVRLRHGDATVDELARIAAGQLLAKPPARQHRLVTLKHAHQAHLLYV